MINSGQKMQERRSLVRWKLNHQAKIKLEGAQRFAHCQVLDLNLKGVRLALSMRLPQDAYLKLTLALADNVSLNLVSWVAWHKLIENRNIYGLIFHKIEDPDKEKIYRFIRSYFPERSQENWYQPRKEEHPRISDRVVYPCGQGGENMANGAFTDKRVFERFPVKFPVRYLNTSANQEGRAKTLDISAKGLGLVTQDDIPVNSALELWLEIPDGGEPLYARGEVVWSDRVGLSDCRSGINLQKADLMGLSRVLRLM